MKITENLDISIKDYAGSMEGGVTSILSIIYDGVMYESVYWYTDKEQIITLPEELEERLGCIIEDYEHFDKIKGELRKMEADFLTIVDKLDSAI